MESVRFCTVRLIEAQQVSVWRAEEELSFIPAAALCVDDLPTYFDTYVMIEIVTVGWKQGAYMRTKKLRPEKALAYVNKLHIGNWISDATYDLMYSATNALLCRNGMWPNIQDFTSYIR